MLRIVLVDDEQIVLRGISALLKRENEYELAGTAENGIDGLEVIRKTRPDIVMTDIRMPGMTGLEMIRRAKKEVPDSVYIVFSGYNEFKYVKEAIGLGVIDYIEKPVTVPKLREVLKKAADLFQYQHHYTEMTLDLKKADRVFVEKTLRDLHEHPSDEEILLKQILEHNPELERAYSVAAVKVREQKSESVDRYRELIQALTFDMIGTEPVEVYSFYEKENLVLVYLNLGGMEFPFLEKTKEKKRSLEEAGILTRMGISRVHRDFFELSAALGEADDALGYARYLEEDDVVAIDEVEYSNPLPGQLRENHESMEFNFRIGNYDDCRRQIREYLDYLRGLHVIPELFVRKCGELVHLMQLMLNESDIGKKNRLDLDYQELHTMVSEEEIAAWTIRMTDQIIEQAEGDRNDGTSRAIRDVKQYMEQHYAEGLGLEELAGQVHMSKTYLSMLFKKEEGIPYIKYLTRIRIEKAKGFLREGYKAKEVCEMVGYHDYKYFSTQFKSSTGMTPENYKRAL